MGDRQELLDAIADELGDVYKPYERAETIARAIASLVVPRSDYETVEGIAKRLNRGWEVGRDVDDDRLLWLNVMALDDQPEFEPMSPSEIAWFNERGAG